jgi:UDP-3-O-acyl-N-acetylglucosamine deacetylase
VVELDGPEVPIGDGSSAPFVEAIVRAGVRPLSGAAREIRITREITVESGGGRITARPREGGGCAYRYELEYGAGAAIPAQSAEWDSGARDRAARYAREVAPARTFCLEAEAKALRAAGLFRHLSAREMLVIGERGPIENSYRFSDEPARHKLLDLIGDLALVGGVLVGEVVAVRSGHALNHEMARALVDRCGG